ncbi:hypothetical protein I3843_12G037800 [Carya illinoinensis]|nr:hypothetical protein I3843_12G037800 [Carya illinoinensis]
MQVDGIAFGVPAVHVLTICGFLYLRLNLICLLKGSIQTTPSGYFMGRRRQHWTLVTMMLVTSLYQKMIISMTCSICWMTYRQTPLLMCPKKTLLRQIGHQYLKIHQQLLLTNYWRKLDVLFSMGVQNLQSFHSLSSYYTSNQSVDGQLSHSTCSLICCGHLFLMRSCHNHMRNQGLWSAGWVSSTTKSMRAPMTESYSRRKMPLLINALYVRLQGGCQMHMAHALYLKKCCAIFH